MPDSQTQREARKTIIPPYRESLSRREYSPGKYAWKETRSEYFVEASEQESIEQIDTEAVRSLFEREKTKPKASSSLLTSFQETALFRLVSESKSVVIQSRAIEELLRRESGVLPGLLVQELGRDDLPPSWRNTLLLAAEHVQFTELSHRKKLRECLKLHSKAMKGEWRPRTQSALRASLRMLLSLMADWRDSLDLLPFLILDYPVRIKRIALLGIQNLFRDFPPPPEAAEKLTSLRSSIAITAEIYLTPFVYEHSEDEFDLGLDALDALIRFAEPCVPKLVASLIDFTEKWPRKQIQKTLHEAYEVWSEKEFPQKEASLALVSKSLNLLNDKQS